MEKQMLSGCRILIVEDDYYQAHDATAVLEQAGAKIIGCKARSIDQGELQAIGPVDIAMLDVNLGGTQSFDFARLLRSHRIPCLFVTGYDGNVVPQDLSDIPLLTKPADEARIVAVIHRLWQHRQAGDGGTETSQSQ